MACPSIDSFVKESILDSPTRRETAIYFLFALLGLVLSSAGLTMDMWQTYASAVLVFLIYVWSYVSGGIRSALK